jgi:hypothetical protein
MCTLKKKEKNWQCKKCTFSNASDAMSCGMCNTDRELDDVFICHQCGQKNLLTSQSCKNCTASFDFNIGSSRNQTRDRRESSITSSSSEHSLAIATVAAGRLNSTSSNNSPIPPFVQHQHSVSSTSSAGSPVTAIPHTAPILHNHTAAFPLASTSSLHLPHSSNAVGQPPRFVPLTPTSNPVAPLPNFYPRQPPQPPVNSNAFYGPNSSSYPRFHPTIASSGNQTKSTNGLATGNGKKIDGNNNKDSKSKSNKPSPGDTNHFHYI